jgi:LysR family transcriptional regulator, regulator for metE and metH
MKYIDLADLKLIKHIVEEGSMVNATQKMFLSQSALSHKLRELESAVGLKVFKRQSKKLILTEAGEVLLKYANKIGPEFDELEKDLLLLTTSKTERIRISTECYTTYSWLPGIIRDFKKSNPSAIIEVKAEATRRPLHFLDEGKLDIAITGQKPPSGTNYVVDFLFEDEFCVVVSGASPLAGKVTVEDFANADLLLYDKDSNHSLVMAKYINQEGIRFKSIHTMQLTEAILEMVAADLAISIMPSWIVTPYVKTKKLKTVKLPNKILKRKWYAVSHRAGSKCQRDFIKLLKTSLVSHDVSNKV